MLLPPAAARLDLDCHPEDNSLHSEIQFRRALGCSKFGLFLMYAPASGVPLVLAPARSRRGIKRLLRPIPSTRGGSCIPQAPHLPVPSSGPTSVWGRRPPAVPSLPWAWLWGSRLGRALPRALTLLPPVRGLFTAPVAPTRDPLDCPASPNRAAPPSPEEKGGSGEKVGLRGAGS